ncbi:hypothetical protein V7201_15450 [Bacillus sp. JJ1122]|uniref:hypothetical protein n=1 Tax=Bacillus sp. JJ1122 TaxID=3122951 RepID=UPI002FFFE511
MAHFISKETSPKTTAPAQSGDFEIICEDNCGMTTFEGPPTFTLVPPLNLCVSTVTFNNWRTITGGNVGNWPSPRTVIYWLEGNERDMTFSPEVSSISFYYSSSVEVTLEAYNAAGNLIARLVEPANYREPVYDEWDLVTIDVGANAIARLRVIGGSNQTGIDNLQVCRIVCPVANPQTCCRQMVEHKTQLVPPALIGEEFNPVRFTNLIEAAIEGVCPEEVIICGVLRKTITYDTILNNPETGMDEITTGYQVQDDVPFQCMINREDANAGDTFYISGAAVLCNVFAYTDNTGTIQDPRNPDNQLEVAWSFKEKDIVKVCVRKGTAPIPPG